MCVCVFRSVSISLSFCVFPSVYPSVSSSIHSSFHPSIHCLHRAWFELCPVRQGFRAASAQLPRNNDVMIHFREASAPCASCYIPFREGFRCLPRAWVWLPRQQISLILNPHTHSWHENYVIMYIKRFLPLLIWLWAPPSNTPHQISTPKTANPTPPGHVSSKNTGQYAGEYCGHQHFRNAQGQILLSKVGGIEVFRHNARATTTKPIIGNFQGHAFRKHLKEWHTFSSKFCQQKRSRVICVGLSAGPLSVANTWYFSCRTFQGSLLTCHDPLGHWCYKVVPCRNN